jgi:hypothetical protein
MNVHFCHQFLEFMAGNPDMPDNIMIVEALFFCAALLIGRTFDSG